jgi:hypothetical protein
MHTTDDCRREFLLCQRTATCELIPPLELDISFGCSHSIVHDHMHYCKVCVGILGAKSHRWPQTCRMGASPMHLLVSPTKEISFCSDLSQGMKHVLIN